MIRKKFEVHTDMRLWLSNLLLRAGYALYPTKPTKPGWLDNAVRSDFWGGA